MKKGRLNFVKHAGLFLALFVFGNLGVVQRAQASVLSFQAIMDASLGTSFSGPLNAYAPLNAVIASPAIPVIAAPSVAVGSALGAPANQTATFAPTSSASNMAFAVFGLGGPKTTSLGGFSSSLGFHSVSGSTTAPVSVGPSAAAPSFNSAPRLQAAPTLDPEPASIFLFGSGLIAVVALGRKRLAAR